MNEKDFLQKIKEIKVNVPDEQFFSEYNAVVYNILKENKQLKEQLEQKENEIKELCKKIKVNEKSRRKMQKSLMEKVQKSEKAREEAIEILKEFLCTEYYCSQGKELYDFCSKLMKQLHIDKGE